MIDRLKPYWSLILSGIVFLMVVVWEHQSRQERESIQRVLGELLYRTDLQEKLTHDVKAKQDEFEKAFGFALRAQ